MKSRCGFTNPARSFVRERRNFINAAATAMFRRSLSAFVVVSLSFVIGACAAGDSDGGEVGELTALLGLAGQQSAPTVQTGRPVTAAEIRAAFDALDHSGFTYDEFVSIYSPDGTRLAANLFQPTNIPAGEFLPAIIFVNSWALEEHQYIVQAAKFAARGYIVLSYSTRGFGLSEGLVNVAGDGDMQDLSAAIDYLEAHTPVDVNRIGMAGISYGGGISLLGLSRESRIKTAVAMSGWADLTRSLYGNQTPRLVWGLLLVASGYVTGRMDPIIAENFGRLLSNNGVAGVLAWAAGRSPASYIEQLNSANKPVYISSNFSDNLFQPNQMLDYFAQLTVPKRLDLNNGIHATAEIGGLLGLSNFVWDNTHDWFDHWLKGEANGIMSRPAVTMKKKFSNERVSFPSWPAPQVTTRSYYLKPRGLFSNGAIQTAPNRTSRTSKIYSGIDTAATTGIPLLSPILEGHVDIPVRTPLAWISRANGVVYQSSRLSEELRIRGKLEYTGRVDPSLSKGQVVVYFYDVDRLGVGKLITHGTATIRDVAYGSAAEVTADLSAVAYDVPAGHRIAIALDTFDALYATPTVLPYNLRFRHSSGTQSTLRIQQLD